VCPLSWRTKVWSCTKREEKSKERMIKARKTLLKCYGRGKYACMPYVGGHCRKPSQHAVRYPPNTFTSSSVLCTIGLHSYLNRNLHFGVMRCQNDSYRLGLTNSCSLADIYCIYSIYIYIYIYSKPGCHGYLTKWGNCTNSPLLASFPLR